MVGQEVEQFRAMRRHHLVRNFLLEFFALAQATVAEERNLGCECARLHGRFGHACTSMRAYMNVDVDVSINISVRKIRMSNREPGWRVLRSYNNLLDSVSWDWVMAV